MYHPFEWDYLANIKEDIILKAPVLNFILTGAGTVSMVNFNTGASHSITTTAFTWEINEKEYTSIRVAATIPTTGRYVFKVDNFWYSPIIEYSACNVLQFETKGLCANQYHDWDSDSVALTVALVEGQMLQPEINTETISIITQNGEKQKSVSQSIVNRVQYLGGNGYVSLLNSFKINEDTYFNTNAGLKQIKNVNIEPAEQADGRYSLFTIKFEYYDDVSNANGCCDILDIDDIINPENPNGDDVNCTGFSVLITKSGDTLTATTSNNPTGGTLVYRWYKNGTLLSTGSTATATESGEYRVDVSKAGCRASAIYLIPNECQDFILEVSKIENDIFGTVSNVPEGETPIYSIKLDGIEVATTLPYTALADGIYYVEVTAGECKKVKAISVKLIDEDCDFTLSITEDGGVLTAVTDAETPIYSWYLDNGEGKVEIGNLATLQIEGSGIYFLTITNGLCEKSVYFVKLQSNKEIHSILHRVTGTEFNVIGIDMNVERENITVFVNGSKYEYSASPTSPVQWGVNGTGKLIVSSAHGLTNATIRVSRI
jgi:hypothetical protein